MECDNCKLAKRCTGMPCLCFQSRVKGMLYNGIAVVIMVCLVVYFYSQF